MPQPLLQKVVENVFPPGASLTRAQDVPPAQRFHVIPGERQPRWIVPVDAQRGWPVLQQWHAYKLSSRAKWAAICALYRCGKLGHLPGIASFGIGFRSRPNWDACEIDAGTTPVIYIGTPTPYRKAVAFLVSTSEVRAVAKFPLRPGAAAKIGCEARVLSRLAVEKPGMAPRLLRADPQAGVAVQEVIPGTTVGRAFGRAQLGFLLNLRTAGEVTLRTLLAEVAARRRPSEWDALLDRALMFVDDPQPLPSCWVHGDFAPWNLKRTATGELCAVDWESAAAGSAPLQDLLHYFATQAYEFGAHRGSLLQVFDGRYVGQYADTVGLEGPVVTRLCCFYLLQQLVDRIHDENTQHAEFLASELGQFLHRHRNRTH